MFSRSTMGSLVLALSVSAAAFGTGCAASSGDDVSSNEGAATGAATTMARSYEGTIGNLKIMLRVESQGTAVTGSYFYADKTTNGDVIALNGTTTGNKIALRESVKGKVTGGFSGTITATGISGTWQAPGGSTLPLALTAIKPGTPKIITRNIKDTQKAPAASQYARDCSLEAQYLEVFGLADAKAETAINALLVPEPLERDDKGACESDIRYVSQTVTLNEKGFLTVQRNSEWDGGAHPDNSTEYLNFNLADGKQLTGKDFFVADAMPKVKALLVKSINAQKDLDADGKKETLDQLDQIWGEERALDSVQLGLTTTGMTLDMANNYPHVILALAPSAQLTWADLGPLLAPGTAIRPLVK